MTQHDSGKRPIAISSTHCSAGGTVRALAAVTTYTVAEAQLRHGLYPTAAAALGRVADGDGAARRAVEAAATTVR